MLPWSFSAEPPTVDLQSSVHGQTLSQAFTLPPSRLADRPNGPAHYTSERQPPTCTKELGKILPCCRR